MDEIRSRHATKEYRDNYDRIFRKDAPETTPAQEPVACLACQRPGTEENPLLMGHVCKECHDALKALPRRAP